ncbi:MAG: hypothetical protein ABSH20_05575 [Tepidisphaeraceae bacterium]
MTALKPPVDTDAPTNPSANTLLHPSTVQRVRATRLGLSLDWWSVIVALILGVLIWTGVLPAIGW